jgi:hypothetical protein
MKRAAKIINNFGYPNCYLVSVGRLCLSDLDTQQPNILVQATSLPWSRQGFSLRAPRGGTGYGKGQTCSYSHEAFR